MNTWEAIARRKSVRAYTAEQIPEQTLQTILQAGCRAPVASGNYDSLHITVVQNPALLKRIADAASDAAYEAIHIRKNMDFGAPTMVIVSSLPGAMAGIGYANAACVLENMVLAAADQKIDSIIWGGGAAAVRRDAGLREMLPIPAAYEPLLCASFGYGASAEPSKEHSIAVDRV